MESMDVGNAPMKSPTGTCMDINAVIEGHRACQSKNGTWLCVRNIYEKLHRPHTYDIGGTYIGNEPDFWFTYKTEKTHGIYLLHLFAGNRIEGTYTIGVTSNTLVFNDKDQAVRMMGDIETYKFQCKQHNQSYITTYSFKYSDVEDILKNKTLYLAVRLSVREENKDLNNSDAVKMLHDNVALLKEPVGSDFIIESEDGVEFPVHRSILCLHSEVFKAMLKEDMVESRNGRVKLVDVSTEDLKIMLEFIYTSTINVIEDLDFSKIIMVADRFNLLGLRKLCDHILMEQLGHDTALDILVIADRFDSINVKNRALQYIRHNKEHFRSAKFDQIDNMALMRELCASFLA